MASLAIAGAEAVAADEPAADLYYRGRADVEAILPSAGITMPSTAMPCINCHGVDGQGGREGGVAVPPISWRRLGMSTADRPAYDQPLLARAVRDGIGADGAPLHAIMPRYALSDTEVSALADWLGRIGVEHERGVSDDEIVIAMTPEDSDDPRADVITSVLRHYMDDLNRKGGLYGRTIRLVDDAAEGDDAFARLAMLKPPARRIDGQLDLWPLHAGDEGKQPAHALIPSDERLLKNLLEAARRDDPAARRLSSLTGDRKSLPKTIVFDGAREALSAFIGNWSGRDTLAIYTTPDRVDLGQLQGLSARPLSIILTNPFAIDRTGDVASASDRRLSFERAAGRLGIADAAMSLARSAWVASALLEEGLRANGRRLDRRHFEATLQAMPVFTSGLLSPIHPTQGPTTTALIAFDLATKEVKRLTLDLR